MSSSSSDEIKNCCKEESCIEKMDVENEQDDCNQKSEKEGQEDKDEDEDDDKDTNMQQADNKHPVETENEAESAAETKTKTNTSDETAETDTEAEPQTEPIDLIAQAVNHKDEGNSHFKSGDLTQASRSYRKGTSLIKNLNKENTGDDQVKALLVSLQTNLSMVCFKQNKHQQSRDVATKVLDVDSKNVKALYRRAVANMKLGDCFSARDDLKLALKMDSNNRAVQKELIAVKKEVEKENKKKKAALSKAFSSKGGSFLYDDKEEEEKRKLAEKVLEEEAKKKAREKRKADWEDECVSRMSKGEEAITFDDYEKDINKKKKEDEKAKKKAKKEEEDRRSKARAAEKKVNAKPEESDDDDDELTEKELQMLRGYKKTTDGRTTSYFTREQTEEEKKLLGSIAPQRLDASVTTPPKRLDSNVSTKSSSAWNQAGTWEEKDTSNWCQESLNGYLKAASSLEVESDSKSFTGRIKEVKDLSGDASVAFVSGKKRYVFDYNAKIKYEIVTSNNEQDDNSDTKVVSSGTIMLPDISSTAIDDELEVDILSWKKSPSDEDSATVTKCRDSLVNDIRSQVTAFVGAFNKEY